MPYQSGFTLLIITGAFTLTGGILAIGNYFEYGKFKRPIQEDSWSLLLRSRHEMTKDGTWRGVIWHK